MIVPKAMSKVTYIAETYESVSLLFFLRLLLTYLGGIYSLYEVSCDSFRYFIGFANHPPPALNDSTSAINLRKSKDERVNKAIQQQ